MSFSKYPRDNGNDLNVNSFSSERCQKRALPILLEGLGESFLVGLLKEFAELKSYKKKYFE